MEKTTFKSGMIVAPNFLNELQDALLSESQTRSQTVADEVARAKSAEAVLASTLSTSTASLTSVLDTKAAETDLTALETTVQTLGTRITDITAQAIHLSLADADATNGIITLNASNYKCDLHVYISNPAGTTVTPPSSVDSFTLVVDGALPAGCQIHISACISGESYVIGDVLPVQVNFSNSIIYGLGSKIYSSNLDMPLLQNGDFSATVMYDGITWKEDSTDIVAMAAYTGLPKHGGAAFLAPTISANGSFIVAQATIPAGKTYKLFGGGPLYFVSTGTGSAGAALLQFTSSNNSVVTDALLAYAWRINAFTLAAGETSYQNIVVPGVIACNSSSSDAVVNLMLDTSTLTNMEVTVPQGWLSWEKIA